jgi:hypothetical protein
MEGRKMDIRMETEEIMKNKIKGKRVKTKEYDKGKGKLKFRKVQGRKNCRKISKRNIAMK